MRKIAQAAFPAAIALLTLFRSSSQAHARTRVAESLEWMTVDSSLVVAATVTNLKDIPGPGSVIYRDLTLKIVNTLKGKSPDKTITLRLRLNAPDTAGEAWVNSGHEFIFFLVPGKDERDSDLGGRWTVRDPGKSVIDPNAIEKLYTMQLSHPKSADEILAIIKKWSTWQPPLKPTGSRPNWSDEQHNYLHLDAGFAGPSFILVPAAEEFRSSALKQAASKDANERANGAEMLKNYPGPETVAVLTKLLGDAFEGQETSGSTLVKIDYPVRKAAYKSLLELGRHPVTPILERTPTKDEVDKCREQSWRAWMHESLPKTWTTTSVTATSAPANWQPEKESPGTCVECRLPATPTQPALTFQLFIMPKDWQGHDKTRSQIVSRDGYTRVNQNFEDPNTARYLGKSDALYFTAGTPDMDARLSQFFDLSH